MTHRRATSLVELLVIMSACSLILTLSAALLHRTMHSYSQSRAFLDVERSATRLSDQFRRDIWDAKQAETTGNHFGPDDLLQLSLTGGEIINYRRADGSILRIAAAPGSPASREEYDFPQSAKANMQVEMPARRVILEITTLLEEPALPSREQSLQLITTPVSLHVEATLGRNLPIETATDSEKPK